MTYILLYDQFINPVALTTPISGIRLVNSWDSKIPEDKQIFLNIGQPDLSTPPYIKEAVSKALEKNLTRYTNILGEKFLRDVIIEYQNDSHNLNYSSNEVLITSGGQSAIFAVLNAVLSTNDNVIVPFPSYPPYLNAIKYNHANIIPFQTTVDDNFDLDINRLHEILRKQPIKVLLLISPSNPTGTIIPKETLEQIVNLATKFNFLIISDEIYSDIIFDNVPYSSIASFPEARERTIIIQSFSKMLSMCGFRIGYILAPTPLIDHIKVIHHTMNICANSLSQYAAYIALKDKNQLKHSISALVKTYQNRRDLGMNLLSQSDNLSLSKPQGAFYLFPKVKSCNTMEFCKWLKYNYGVVTVPGSYFSIEELNEHRQYFRLCFTTDRQKLEQGINKILLALEEYKKM